MLNGKAARIFRCRPDGTRRRGRLRRRHGQPRRDRLHPRGRAVRHRATSSSAQPEPHATPSSTAIEGGVFPWHDVLNEFKRTGDLLPAVGRSRLGRAGRADAVPRRVLRRRITATTSSPPSSTRTASSATRRARRGGLPGRRARTSSTSQRPRLPPDRRAGGRRRQPARRRHRRLVPHRLPDRRRSPSRRSSGRSTACRKKDAPRVEDPWGVKLAWDKVARGS